MTNEQVRDGFNEVYNQFWNKYKNNAPQKDSQEWDRIVDWSEKLRESYSFMKETILSLVEELDQRMRRGEGKRD